jgi:hypothetical protein
MLARLHWSLIPARRESERTKLVLWIIISNIKNSKRHIMKIVSTVIVACVFALCLFGIFDFVSHSEDIVACRKSVTVKRLRQGLIAKGRRRYLYHKNGDDSDDYSKDCNFDFRYWVSIDPQWHGIISDNSHNNPSYISTLLFVCHYRHRLLVAYLVSFLRQNYLLRQIGLCLNQILVPLLV